MHQNMLWFFSDEKKFVQTQKHNVHNDCWLAQSPFEVPRIMVAKFPLSVMVLSVISSEGDVMPPFFFEDKQGVNQEVYQKALTKHVFPWMKRIAQGRKFVFQQDGATCHTARPTIDLIKKHCTDLTYPNQWPPNSPDLNPCDYFLWGTVERMSNETGHSNRESLIAAIKSAHRRLKRSQVQTACSRFRRRVEMVIAADGGFIE